MMDPAIFLLILMTCIVALVYLIYRPHFRAQKALWKKVQANRKKLKELDHRHG